MFSTQLNLMRENLELPTVSSVLHHGSPWRRMGLGFGGLRHMGFSVSLNKDIERWVVAGLIDRATGDALNAELANRPGRFGLGAVLGVLGAVLLGAALLSVVAANWEEIPRLLRVALILVTILAGFLIGAWREGKGDNVFSGTLYLLAAIAFGGGIALIGQMYHLSGDTASAAWGSGASCTLRR